MVISTKNRACLGGKQRGVFKVCSAGSGLEGRGCCRRVRNSSGRREKKPEPINGNY